MKYKVNDLIMWHDSKSCYRVHAADFLADEYILIAVWSVYNYIANSKSFRTQAIDIELFSNLTTEEELFRLQLE